MFSIANFDSKLVNRFWAKTEIRGANDCWIWKGSKRKSGYGKFYLNGKRVAAHRVSFWINNGCFDSELDVLHSCDNPSCVNPAHLWTGTAKDNINDMMRKQRGNHRKGEDHATAILTERDVIRIRWIRKNEKKTLKELSVAFGVSTSAISHIVKERHWKHLLD